MKKFLVVLTATALLFAGCGGGEDMTQLNTDVATTMQKDLTTNGVPGEVDAACRSVKSVVTCDIFITLDGKRQRVGDANNVHRTDAGITWDHES